MFNLNTGLLQYWFEGVAFDLDYPPYVLIPAILAVCAVGYLFGSINTAIIVSKTIFREDVRTKGSGNAGLTNMLRNYGAKGAVLTLVGDILKTALAIGFAGLVFGFQYVRGISVSNFCYIAGLFAVMGHIFPVYYGFKGGKGVLATSTLALILTPIPFLILLLIFIGIVAVSKYVSLGSVSVAVLYPIILQGTFSLMFKSSMPPFTALTAIVLACLIVWCHRANLQRISNKTENKLSFKKKSKDRDDG